MIHYNIMPPPCPVFHISDMHIAYLKVFHFATRSKTYLFYVHFLIFLTDVTTILTTNRYIFQPVHMLSFQTDRRMDIFLKSCRHICMAKYL